eukprot:COSAG06_NODE_71656_length_181_cov_23.256098_1_plen_34_part_01
MLCVVFCFVCGSVGWAPQVVVCTALNFTLMTYAL